MPSRTRSGSDADADLPTNTEHWYMVSDQIVFNVAIHAGPSVFNNSQITPF